MLLGILSLYLLITGLNMHSAYAKVTSCHPGGSAACRQVAQSFNREYWGGGGSSALQAGGAQSVSSLLLILPVLIGVFTGAPLLARELETGTFRLAWTQGCGRLRWAISKLLPLEFGLRGVAFAGWTLAAFAIGAFAGTAIRRTVPAMAASLAVWIVLDLGTAISLRPHYQAPMTTKTANPPSSAWVVSSWYTGPNGQPVSQQAINQLVQHASASVQNSPDPNAVQLWLSQQHYTQWTAYQPDSRFWSFQLIEGGWLLALSVVLIAATVWLVRRRAA